MRQQKFAAALADFNRTIELDPQLDAPYFNRGLSMLMLDKVDEAERDFAKARALAKRFNPESEEIINRVKGMLESRQQANKR